MPRHAVAKQAAPQPHRAGQPAHPPPAAAGFDITPTAVPKPRPPGLSGAQKGYLALAMLMVMAGVALAADILAAREGNPPTRGIERLAEGLDDDAAAQEPPASDPGQGQALTEADASGSSSASASGTGSSLPTTPIGGPLPPAP